MLPVRLGEFLRYRHDDDAVSSRRALFNNSAESDAL